MFGGGGTPQRGSITEDAGSSVLKNSTIPTWMKAVNRTPTKDHISYKQFIREEKPIVTAKYPFLTSSQIERKLRLEWQTTMRSEKGRYKSSRSSPHKRPSAAEWEYLVGEVDTTEADDRQERVFSPKLGPRLGTKTYGGGASWIHQSLTPPKIIQKGPNKAMNGILSRSTEKPRGSTGKVSFQQMMPSRERSKSESSISDEQHQPTDSYVPKCNMRKCTQEKEKFGGDIYSLSDSDSDKDHQHTDLHKSTKDSATKRGSATKSARRMSHAHTRVRKSKDDQKTKCALLFGQENTGVVKEDDACQLLGAELSDSDDERDRQLLGLEGNVLITERKESGRRQKKTRKSASTQSRPTTTGRQRTITSMFSVMETFSNKDNHDKISNEKCPKSLSDADTVDSKELELAFNPTECVQSQGHVDMDENDNDDGPSNHFPESETTQLFSKISKLKQSVLGTTMQATPQNTEGANKLIKIIQTPSTDSKTLSDLTTPANPESLVQQVIKKASKVPHKKRPNEQVSQSENTLKEARVAAPVSSPKQKKARRSLDVTSTSTSSNATCHKRKTRSVMQPLELESPLAEPFCPNKGRNKKSSIATFEQKNMSVSEDLERESHSEMEFQSIPAQECKNQPNSNTSMSSPKFLKGELKGKTPRKSAEMSDEDANEIMEPLHPSSTILLTSPKRLPAEPAPNVRRTPVRTPVKRTSTNFQGGFSATPSPRSNVRRAPATPIFRRSPRLTNPDLQVKESTEPIPLFKTPKGLPAKAKSRKSVSPKLTSKVNEETCLKPRGLSDNESTHQDTSLPRGLNTYTHPDNLVPCDLANEEDTSLSGDLNVDKSVHLDSSVPSDMNKDTSSNSGTTASSGLNKIKHQNMNVSSFYKTQLKHKKDNILTKHHSKLPVQSAVRPTSPESKIQNTKYSPVKGSKVKGSSNNLHYFGFEDDLDDHDIDESYNKENSDPIDCCQDEHDIDNKCIKENTKPVKAKSGRHKIKDVPEMGSTDGAQTEYKVDGKDIKENRLPAKAKRVRKTVEDVAEIKSPNVADNEHIKENRMPAKAKGDTEVSSHPSAPHVKAVVKPTSPKNKKTAKKTYTNTPKAKGSKIKGSTNNLDYFGFGEDMDDHDMDDANNKETSDPIECYQDEYETDNTCIKENVKSVKAKSGRHKTKNTPQMESLDASETDQNDDEVDNEHIKRNRVPTKAKGATEMVKHTPGMESPNADETHQNDYGVNDRSIKEKVKPAKTKSGRHKIKGAPEMESPDPAEPHQNYHKVNDKSIKENVKPAKAKNGRHKIKNAPEMESLDAFETDQNDDEVDDNHVKESRVSAKAKRHRQTVKDIPEMESPDAGEADHGDSRIDEKHMNEKVRPAKTKSSKHKTKEDTAESPHSDHDIDGKHSKDSMKPARTKKGRHRTKDTPEMESEDVAEPYNDEYSIDDTQHILNMNPLDTLIEGFRKKNALQLGEPFNWDSCPQDDNEEDELVNPDKNDMLAEDEKSDDTPPPTQSQSAMTAVQDALQKLRTIASPDILNMDEFEDYEFEEVLSSLQSSQHSSQISDLSSLSVPSDQENSIPTKSDRTAPKKGAGDTEHSTSTKKDTTVFRKPTNNLNGDRMKETKKTCPKMTYGKKVGQMGQGDGLSWASDLFDDIVPECKRSQKMDTGAKEKPKSKHDSVQQKERGRPKTPDVDVCGLFEETPRTSARRLLTSSQRKTDSNFQDLFLTKDSSSFFM